MRNHFPGTKQHGGNVFNPHDIIIVGLDTIDGVEHPLFDGPANAAPVNEGLVRSIQKHGFFGAVLCQRIRDVVLCEDGRQRVKAAREAYDRAEDDIGRKLAMVPVLFRDGTEADLLGVVVAANEHRRDIPILEKARLAARLRAAGESVDEVAVTFGVTPPAVRQWLDLLKTPVGVQRAVAKGDFPATQAVKHKDLPAEDQEAIVKESVAAKGDGRRQPSRKQVREARDKVAKPMTATKTTFRRGKKELKEILGIALDGNPDKRSAAQEAFRRGVLWAIGEITDGEAGMSKSVEAYRSGAKQRPPVAKKRGFAAEDMPK